MATFHSWCFLALAAATIAASQPAEARSPRRSDEPVRAIASPRGATDNRALAEHRDALNAAASAETTILLSNNFNAGSGCAAQGWTSVDLTAQKGNFWHVEDYAFIGLPFGAIEGTKSLWCGLPANPGPSYCNYLALPGYGNSWDQGWCTKNCIPVVGALDVAFHIRYDSEPSYDATSLEYTNDCSGNAGWIEIDGGNPSWSGQADRTIMDAYTVNPGPVKVRLRFRSDPSWSDEDGLFNSAAGAVHIDSLVVEGLALENFEDEAVGATSSNDWQSCIQSYGDHAGLFSGSTLLQEDPCRTNLSCMWAFIQNSTATYACGGHPEQIAVPYQDASGRYINNDIWSPLIPISGTGTQFKLAFDVYRDLPFESGLIVYIWKVRTIVNGCPTGWKTDNFYYGGDAKDWFRHVADLGSRVNLTGATHLQVAIGVSDFCPFRCWWFGNNPCHSHAPLIDNVEVYRVNVSGPQWTVRDVDTFQDTFSTNGSITGTARADMARNIHTFGTPSILPGDSAVVNYLADPTYGVGAGTDASGLLNDPNLSTFIGRHKTKKQAYLYVSVWPLGQANKSGAGLSEGPGGQANRFPFSGTVVANGVTWTKIRMDYAYTGNAVNPGVGDGTDPFNANRFTVDLNDNLFTPGDTVCYFFGATSPGGTTYYSESWKPTNNIDEVAANPMEFTILPAGGYNRGGDVLYVDGADGLGVQPYYDGAFMALGAALFIDRYDVRGPSSAVGNRPAGRVYNVAAQLNACYHEILWDTGSLPVTLGDGTGNPETSNDWGLLNTFLDNLTGPGGVVLCGDNVGQNLIASAGSSAATFRGTYMPFNLASGNHQAAGLGVSPSIMAWPGRMFSDNFIAFGGCPELNGFDVMNASATSLVQMSYSVAQSTNGAVVSNINGNARVLLAGFSLSRVSDDETNGVSDRVMFLYSATTFLGGSIGYPSAAGPMAGNSLAQNYPNPFNPQTTIAFSLKAKGHVEINVYDVGGRLVRTLVNEVRPAGAQDVTWDGRDGSGTQVATGVYFYRLTAQGFTQTKKMVLLK